MRVVVQRVTHARVRQVGAVPEREVRIGRGLLILVGFTDADAPAALEWMARKCLGLRVFADDNGALNCSVEDVRGAILAVPNFTLYGDARKGRRPSFTRAAEPALAQELFEQFVDCLRGGRVRVEVGFFQEHMHVELTNDGPVTLTIERETG